MIAEGARYVMGGAERALRFLSLEVRGLHAAAYVLAAAALLSSLLALVRDRLLAHTFGASVTVDIYYAGFRVPDLLFVATGALVSAYILIPELVKRSESAQRDYIDTIVAGFSALAIVVSAAVAWMAPELLSMLFPHFVLSGHIDEVVEVTRILLLQPVLLGLSNILAAITQMKHRYALYAISPLLYNLGIIVGISSLYPLWGVPGLAWGVVIGAALHFGIQIPSAVTDGFLRRMPRLREPRAFLRTIAISIPRSLALSLNQLAFLGLTVLAATLPAGSIAVFMFGFNLQAVPLAIIGASYSVAAFPTLALALSRGERDEFIAHVATAARYVFFWSLPVSALILVLRAHIVRVILGSGAFDWSDTRLTAAAFALFSLSLASQGLMLLLVRGYYAAGRTFVPFAIALLTALGTVTLGAATMLALSFEPLRDIVEELLRVENISGSAVLALAFSYAVATILGSLVMLAHFEYRFRGFFAQLWRAMWQAALAALGCGFGAYVALQIVSGYVLTSTALSVFLHGFVAGMFGLLIGVMVYFVLESREFLEVWASVRARLWREQPKEEVTLAASAEQ